MNEKRLIWTEEGRKKVLDCRVFSVWESYCKSPQAQPVSRPSTFSVIDTRDYVIVIPVMENNAKKQFVMVWQWRHGSKCLSLEFPGGVLDDGEEPEKAALRELQEETGYIPGKIEKIGEFSPNPAIMSNKVHFYLAKELVSGKQKPDEDEYLEVALVDAAEVIQGMGKEPYVHALMGAALSLYNRQK